MLLAVLHQPGTDFESGCGQSSNSLLAKEFEDRVVGNKRNPLRLLSEYATNVIADCVQQSLAYADVVFGGACGHADSDRLHQVECIVIRAVGVKFFRALVVRYFAVLCAFASLRGVIVGKELVSRQDAKSQRIAK
jgi:hypothetical protein